MRILIAGDSLGLPRPHRIQSFNPAEETNLAIHYDETYGFLLDQELSALYNDQSVHVINRAQRFFTIKNIYDQFTDHLFFFQPDILIIHVGIVDCWYRENSVSKQMVPLYEFTEIYNHLIRLSKQRLETKVIFVGICLTSIKMAKRYEGMQNEIRQYNGILKSAIDHNQFFYIDMESHINPQKPQEHLLPDDCHLNKQGNILVKGELMKVVIAIIENQAGCFLFNDSEENKKQALNRFKHSFDSYAYYVDNLYNLLVLAYELQEFELLDKVIQYVWKLKTKEPDLIDLLHRIKENLQR